MKMNELEGQHVLITGGNKGIGRAIALTLAGYGAKVALSYLSNVEEAEQVASEIRESGGTAAALQADVTKLEDIDRLVNEAEAALGGTIDILINNAGHLVQRCVNSEMTEDLYARVMDVNFKGTIFTSKRVIPGMKAKGRGRIVNLTSLAAHNGGGPGATIYAASKAAIITYTKGLAKELASHQITVNSVSPGFIGQTAFHATFTSDEARQATVKGIPLGREGTPDDVAGAVLYLVSGLAGYVTGETIEINGGMFMR
jgi:3-oxoacyl-[acyl-carrier protein] reductase